MVSWEPMGEGDLELNKLEICYMHANDRLVAKGLQTYTMIDIGRNSADFFFRGGQICGHLNLPFLHVYFLFLYRQRTTTYSPLKS